MIIVADAHISKTQGNYAAFFKMLAALARTDHDLIFLGDIFDLWVALPRYEEDIQGDFIAWCREQKSFRSIGYMEGNHEYFLAAERARAFTWCSEDAWKKDKGGTLYVHGDQINRQDRRYLGFRKLIKNNMTKLIFRGLPFGPDIAAFIKNRLKKTNKSFRLRIPRAEIQSFAESKFAEGFDTIFMGHFHQEYCYRRHTSKELHILPDWLSTQRVTLYQKNPKIITTMHWKEI